MGKSHVCAENTDIRSSGFVSLGKVHSLRKATQAKSTRRPWVKDLGTNFDNVAKKQHGQLGRGALFSCHKKGRYNAPRLIAPRPRPEPGARKQGREEIGL